MSLDVLQHAILAERLIKACGGVARILEMKITRAGKSQLYAYQSKDSDQTMSAEVMADLEGYCGDPVYSRFLSERHKPHAVESLLNAVSEADYTASDLQRELIRALHPDSEGGAGLSRNELADLMDRYLKFMAAGRAVGTALAAADQVEG